MIWILIPIFLSATVQLIGLIKETEQPITFIKRNKNKISIVLILLSCTYAAYDAITKPKALIPHNDLVTITKVVPVPYPVREKSKPDSVVPPVVVITTGNFDEQRPVVRNSQNTADINFQLEILNKGLVKSTYYKLYLLVYKQGQYYRYGTPIYLGEGQPMNNKIMQAANQPLKFTKDDTLYLRIKTDYFTYYRKKALSFDTFFRIANDKMTGLPSDLADTIKKIFKGQPSLN